MPLDPDLNKFTTAAPAIKSYAYTDLAEGTGIQPFYLYSSETSTGTTYHLTGTIAYSDDIYRSCNGVTGTTDDDYDLTGFSLPKTIEGTASLIIPWAFAYSGSSGSGSGYMVCKIRHWDGTTETDLATVTSPTITIAALAAAKNGVWNFPMPISLKQFQAGEVLRVNIAMTVSGTEAVNASMSYGIDPKARTWGSAATSQSVLLTPFRLDL